MEKTSSLVEKTKCQNYNTIDAKVTKTHFHYGNHQDT